MSDRRTAFDAITKDKPTLAGFLRSLPVIEAPWDGAFQERFCVECGADSCDDCPNEQFRNNPEWWLSLPAAEVEQRRIGRAGRLPSCKTRMGSLFAKCLAVT